MLDNLVQGIKKEFLLIVSQKTALLLTLLFPIIIIGTFGGLYSGALTQTISVAVFVDQNSLEKFAPDPTNPIYQKIDFVTELKKNEKLKVYPAISSNEIRELVLQNVVDAGLIIEKSNKKEAYDITVILDSTDFVQSAIIWGNVSNQLNSISNQLSVSIIQKIWNRIVSQERSTQNQLQRVDSFLVRLEETKIATQKIEQKVDSIRPEELLQYLHTLKSEIVILKSEVQNLKTNNQILLNELNGFDDYFRGLMVELGRASWEGKIIHYDNPADGLIESRLAEYAQQLANSVEQQQALLVGIEQKLDSLQELVNNLESRIQNINQYIINFKDFLQEAREVQDQLKSDLTESKALLEEINETIGAVKGYSPEFLAKPTQLHYGEIQQFSNLATVFFPTVLALVAMFTAMLLTAISIIAEKRQGVIARLKTTCANKAIIILGKLLGMLFIVLIEIAVLVLLGNAFFGIELYGEPIAMLESLILITLAFIGMGLLIGSFTKTESNAILATLVIVLPLIFLSGLLLPIELMPAGFQVLKIINPLSTSSTLLVNTFLKALPFAYSIKEILNLFIITLLGILVAYKKYM